MNILLATSEAVPFAKTGGLADVTGALPRAISKLGHEISLILPAYQSAYQSGQSIEPTDIRLDIPIGNKTITGRILKSCLPDSDVAVYLVEQDDYYNRTGIYGHNGTDYRDNCQRFIFFCRATMEAIRLLDLKIDMIHCNDWPTGLIPAYLEIEYGTISGYENIVSLLTIHNMAYHGRFWHWDMLLTGLDWKYFNWHQMEFFGDLNLLKTAIVFSDAVNTVSPRYATEICKSPMGCGLEGVLSQRRDVLSGIINGVDYDVWNPGTDEFIAHNYGPQSWETGKSACKSALQQQMGLPEIQDVPLIGIVSRLVDQKGFDLISQIIKTWLAHTNAQWAILGSGENRYHKMFEELVREHPNRIAACLSFDNKLAHRIEAGADMFLMPSRYEPCGLNQLYSLKYGTVPIVHGVGGLADTISDVDTESQGSAEANGFRFDDYNAAALDATIRRACEMYQTQPAQWKQLALNGMNQDWSWNVSAKKYIRLYQETIARAKQTVCA